MDNSIRILLVDDHQMIRDCMHAYLDDDSYQIVAEASHGIEGLKMLEKHSIDMVITDISMPYMDGFEFSKKVSEQYPHIKIIVLTMQGEHQFIKQLLNQGVVGYLLKNSGEEELRKAVDAVAAGNSYYSPEVTRVMMESFKPKSSLQRNKLVVKMDLTSREKEVLHLILKEYSNKEIAEELFISPRTVDAHKRNLLEKSGSKNLAGLILYAIENQLVDGF